MAKLSRRDFVKLSAGSTAALGVALLSNPDFEKLFAAALDEVPVIWLQGASDTGCSESILNAVGPTIYEVLLGPIGQKHLSVRFHQTIMAAQGEIAMQALEDTAMTPGYVLVVEGGKADCRGCCGVDGISNRLVFDNVWLFAVTGIRTLDNKP